jgi:hypothetical protein
MPVKVTFYPMVTRETNQKEIIEGTKHANGLG